MVEKFYGLNFFNKIKIYEEQRAVLADSTHLFLDDYQEVFKLKTHNLLPRALHYLQGLFQSERNKRNIERMVEHTDSNYQSQQQFISDSPWSSEELMSKIGVNTNNLLGDKSNQALSIDESSKW